MTQPWLPEDGEPARTPATFARSGDPSVLVSVLPGDGGTLACVDWFDGRWRTSGYRPAPGLLIVERGELRWPGAPGAPGGSYRVTPVKQVLLYRRDLKMRKGKIAAQCAHASLAALLAAAGGPPDEIRLPLRGPVGTWTRGRFTKIVLSVADEEALLAAHGEAEQLGLPCSLITDAGRTEFHGVPTRTTVALGPWASGAIDAISGPSGSVQTKLA